MQNTNQIPDSKRCEPVKLYKKLSVINLYEGLQSLRNCEIFRDIKLETEDNKIIHAHKVVLSAVSPYFHSMFTNFAERNHDLVLMKQFDSTALQQLEALFIQGKSRSLKKMSRFCYHQY